MKHILVVEDEVHLAVGIKYNLEAEGYHVTAVGDGPAALQLLQDSPDPVHLVVLDLMLPGMSGYAVCETLRSSGHDLPVLILSARTLAEDRTRGFDVGADQYLMKPFDLDELLSRVRNLLARHERLKAGAAAATPAGEGASESPPGETPVGASYSFGDATINFDSYQVTVRGEPVRLTALQMKLLRYFVEHAGRVVSRDELLENVWGFSSSPTTRTVDQFVHDLRQTFEKDPAQPRHFLTIRGAGYRFVPAAEGKEPEPKPKDASDTDADEAAGPGDNNPNAS
jgi:two-component system OmpR family response regulator